MDYTLILEEHIAILSRKCSYKAISGCKITTFISYIMYKRSFFFAPS